MQLWISCISSGNPKLGPRNSLSSLYLCPHHLFGIASIIVFCLMQIKFLMFCFHHISNHLLFSNLLMWNRFSTTSALSSLGPGRPSAGGPRMDHRVVTISGVVNVSRLASRLRRSARRESNFSIYRRGGHFFVKAEIHTVIIYISSVHILHSLL